MLPPKYMSEEGLFEALGDFSMELLKVMGDEEMTPQERAKWLSTEWRG